MLSNNFIPSYLITFAKTSFLALSATSAVAFLAVYKYQNNIVYPASLNGGHKHVSTPEEYGLPFTAPIITTKDGESLHSYLLLHDSSDPNYTNKTIIVLSPNAGNIGHFLPVVKYIYETLNYNVFIYSYRGYGHSTGKPTEEGLKLDADAAMQFVAEHSQLSSSSIILYGRSLGGAVSIYIAAHYSNMISGIVLENTFLNLRKVIPHIFPILSPFSFLCHEVWPSEEDILKIKEDIPMLFFSGLDDEIVPPDHMQTLYQLCKSTVKEFKSFEGAKHNDTIVQPMYWDYFVDFVKLKINPIGK
ncbi:hypothetical protein CANARDRAFT_9900 [[Candida] arabinofermentans NRRL YB-2248]|uniref:AB hydrolase-1 domain-containing protein n=1 Tax=[Candida] arabinofermentans NRRL YB-2248 TaxID=983967 RepID=A0A1E4SUJ6_9ASCO|nr:hypothetical protein CANARDRAFT_9900 [[Candida] arabinofermentans NRRL YB-2248]